jgi:hypothetical protein
MTLCTARLNIGSIRFPLDVPLAVVPVLLAEMPETPETLDLRDVDLAKSAPRVADDGSSVMATGDSERGV